MLNDLKKHMLNTQSSELKRAKTLSVKKILMIKSHSMGIGDLLRSSAAWRALKDQWPGVELHLLFLSKHPGYAAEELMKSHHLLSSATFLTLREGSPHMPNAKKTPYKTLRAKVRSLSQRLNPDLVIDFEASGLRTTLVTRCAAKVSNSKSLGIAQFPGRGLLYDISAPSTFAFAKQRGLTLPMDYTNRDFVVLSAIGIERGNRSIELEISHEGALYAAQLRHKIPQGRPVLGLNIGCGTIDAIPRRPAMRELVECVGLLLQKYPHTLMLSGAEFERDVNKEFVATYAARWGNTSHIYDLAGETSMNTLCGLIDICNVFISSDSGPYHVAVAMKKPTMVWFTYQEVAAFHELDWCKRLIKPNPEQFLSTFESLTSAYIKK